jgi:hypothetical protein
MSNWTPITIDNLKAAGYGFIVDQARTKATGGIDPATEAIADVVSKIRGACSAGNQLDADPAKVPNSLKGMTVRMAFFALMERLQLPLNEDQRDTKRNDNSYLLRINDNKIHFETPDVPAGSAEMQKGDSMETITHTPRKPFTREGMDGLL